MHLPVSILSLETKWQGFYVCWLPCYLYRTHASPRHAVTNAQGMWYLYPGVSTGLLPLKWQLYGSAAWKTTQKGALVWVPEVPDPHLTPYAIMSCFVMINQTPLCAQAGMHLPGEHMWEVCVYAEIGVHKSVWGAFRPFCQLTWEQCSGHLWEWKLNKECSHELLMCILQYSVKIYSSPWTL